MSTTGSSRRSARYVPSGSSSQSIIQSLNDYISTELALPGSWSSKLFYSDLKTAPVQSKRILANTLEQANREPMSYLMFFEQSHGYPKNVSDFCRELYPLFERGSIMLYFEDCFLRLLEETTPDPCDEIVLQYVRALSHRNIGQWDAIVAGIGACCYQFFAKEPELYIQLVYRTGPDCPEHMTDQELLDKIAQGQSGLSPNKYNGKISIHDSRTELLRLYQDASKSSFK